MKSKSDTWAILDHKRDNIWVFVFSGYPAVSSGWLACQTLLSVPGQLSTQWQVNSPLCLCPFLPHCEPLSLNSLPPATDPHMCLEICLSQFPSLLDICAPPLRCNAVQLCSTVHSFVSLPLFLSPNWWVAVVLVASCETEKLCPMVVVKRCQEIYASLAPLFFSLQSSSSHIYFLLSEVWGFFSV